ncbi:DUF3987 domain-containing protein [Gemmata sp. JC673]|uniref:DUF3987 domain-containing protein n=1 Tax=Gemmata algarum TaxID=2975278 RepID=A0ABU5F307_9BACT|nr:DUF3987 domain-containing protein [Gemmata algarum]MDY3561967.1 DUF3987 domain-containing protein [Gemmata algarum]
MSPVELLLSKLHGVKKVGTGWTARCPAHKDARASLSVSAGTDGTALVKCHAGCTTGSVVAAIELAMSDLFPGCRTPPVSKQEDFTSKGRAFPHARDAVAELERQHGKRSALWTYTTTHGEPVGVVIRWDRDNKKNIRPVSRHPNGWRIEAMPDPRPLYNLPALANAAVVLVVEGEKCADAARALGFTATTSVGGSQAARKTDWSPLVGKEVWLLPDNDEPGRKYAETVTDTLVKLSPPAVVKVVGLPDLPPGGDIADWIDACGTKGDVDALRAEIEALAATVEPEVGATADDADRFRPFPVGALPQPARGLVTAGAKAIGCDPSYLALPLLVALASAIGTTRRLELKRGWSAPAILWAAVVGESGTAKTPAFKLVMRPPRDRQRKAMERHDDEKKQYEVELARWEKDYAAWKRSKGTTLDPPAKPDAPESKRYVVSDITVEALAPILQANPRGVLLARDELAGWLGSFDRYAGNGKSGTDSANWLSMFNAESVVVDRKTGTPRTVYVTQAAVCVAGGIQPGILQRALGAEHRESGLAARLLLACPPRKAKTWTEADIDPRAEAEMAALFDQLYELQPTETEGEPQPVLVRLSPAAKSAWTAYYDAHAAEQADLTGDLSAAWSKLEEYAARLALVVHFVRWAAHDPKLANAEIVDAESMAAGITLAGWFKHEARRVYALLSESEADRDRRRLVEWVERRGGRTTAREAQQGCRWLSKAGTAEAALEELVKLGRGSWLPPQTTEKGGRPKRVFTLPTPLPVYESSSTHVEDVGSVDVDTVDEAETHATSETELFPFGANNPDDPDGDRLFPNPSTRGLPD